MRVEVAIARLCCGTALLITNAVSGIDGIIVSVALILLGVPFEVLIHEKE